MRLKEFDHDFDLAPVNAWSSIAYNIVGNWLIAKTIADSKKRAGYE